MSRYNTLLIAFVFLFIQSISLSKNVDYKNFEELTVGKSPVFSFHWGTTTHVFCAGYDANGDGIFQQHLGDENPSWWTIGRSGGRFVINSMKQFEFGSMNEDFKPAIDFQNRMIYIPFKDKVSSYDIQTTNLIEDAIYEGSVEAVRSAGPHLLIIDKGEVNQGSGDFDNCKLVVLDITLSMTLQQIPLLGNASDVIYYQNEDNELVVGFLSKPTFMIPNYQIQYGILPHQQMPNLSTLELNNEVSSFIHFNNAIYVSFVDSPEIKKIESDGTITTLSNGLTSSDEWNYYGTQMLRREGNKLHILTNFNDLRTLDENDAIEVISEVEHYETSNMFSFWINQEYILIFDKFDIGNNKVYMGKEVIDSETIFKYANVGSQPSKIIYSKENDTYNVFCLGVDANFNGEFDQGDEKPSWWRVKGAGNSVITSKVMDFEMGDIKFPTRMAYDEEIGVLYIPHNGRVASYDIFEGATIEERFLNVNAIAVELAGTHLLVSLRGQNQEDELVVYEKENGQAIQKFIAGNNILQSMFFRHTDGMGLAILNEGTWGQGNSSIIYGDLPHQQMPTLKEVNIGDGGNDMTYGDGNILAVSNGSHELNVINFATDEVLTLWTGTNGWNGPRNIKSIEDVAIISTYQGDLRMLSKYGVNGIIKIKGKVEDFYLDHINDILVACVINNDDYSPSKEIAYFGQLTKSVETKNIEEINLQVYPNPTTEFVYVRQQEPSQSNIEVYDITGKMLYSSDFYGAITKIDVAGLNLGTGTYIVKLRNEKEIKTAKFNVIK